MWILFSTYESYIECMKKWRDWNAKENSECNLRGIVHDRDYGSGMERI